MHHLVNDAKLKEEDRLCNDPFKLHDGSNEHLATPSIELKSKITLFHGQTVGKDISLRPNTPNSNQEKIDIVCGAKTTLSSVLSSLPSAHCFSSPTSGSFFVVEAEADASEDARPLTPKGVFDPFAPGPEDMALAPICKKLVKVPRKIIARRLKFDDSNDGLEHRNQDADVETLSEEIILEYVYQTLLQAVILNQTEAFVAENQQPSYAVTVKTPPDTKLTGSTDACPAAPIKKLASRSPNMDAVRRKLEF